MPVTLGVILFGIGGDAQANSAIGLSAMATLFFALVAFVALLLSALLAVAGWVTAMRGPTSVGGIFGRGFLGVSAVLSFGIGAAALAGVFELYSMDSGELIVPVIAIAVLVFLAVEFVIGATLYGRAHARSSSKTARGLSVLSYVIAGVLLVGAFAVALMALLGPEPMDDETAELLEYQRGCDLELGDDCNMLGLRLQSGTGTRPPDENAAAAAFRKGCDLGTAIACLNAAEHYAGYPQDATPEHSEAIYRRRYAALVAEEAGR